MGDTRRKLAQCSVCIVIIWSVHVCRIGSFTLIHFSVASAVMTGYFSYVAYMHNRARLVEDLAVEQALLGTASVAGG